MDNVYKAIKKPGKAPQILSSSAKPLFELKGFGEHFTASQSISKAVLSKKPRNRKGYNSRRWSKPDFGYQNQQEKIQDSQPTQHKTEGKANSNRYNGSSRSHPFVQWGRGKKPE
ncbi:hypothetical protein AYI69_g201 [Smittium culicis]|uniref:Uncharacterized protein n=1 Tax=Smittium culicis TaxID=133412 RepID=A0A1R1YTN4_9FUNG|nr:hypothetical protein AYI69_g201 [Smittium culicis]